MKRNVIKVVVFTAFVIAALAYASRSDYNEQVIYNMPEAQYNSIVKNLTSLNGKRPTDSQIVRFYLSNQE